MTNFKRALLALITFITGVGLSLGIGGSTATVGATNDTPACYTQVTEYSYKKSVKDYKTQSRYAKYTQTRTATSSNGGNTWSAWSAWSAWTPWGTWYSGAGSVGDGWANSTVDVIEGPAPHGSGYYDDSGNNQEKWERQYRYQKVDTRQVENGSHWEYSGWVTTTLNSPWVLIETRQVNGVQIPCEEQPADDYDTRTDDGECTDPGQNTVTVTVYRTNFTYVLDNYFQWVRTQNGDEYVYSTSERPLTEAEQITCVPSYDPEVVVTETVCVVGATQVTITTTTTTYHAEYVEGVWVKVANEPTVVVTFRPLLEGEIVTCVPTREPKVVTVDDGVPACADISVNTTTTTTNYTYTYVDGTWVETATDVVTHGSRPVVPTLCPITTTPTTVVVPLVAPNTPLPKTGRGTGGLTIGAILFGTGILALAATRRRKVSNA